MTDTAPVDDWATDYDITEEEKIKILSDNPRRLYGL